MRDEVQETAQALSRRCRERIAEIFLEKGFLPSSHQLLLSRDPSFTWARRRRVFATTPHLRWELAASFLLHSLRGPRKPGPGRSLPLPEQSRLSGEASAFYFTGLILELLEASREGEASDWEKQLEREFLREAESDFLEYPQGEGRIPLWGYFPVKHHRFHPGNLIYRLMHGWGAIAADLDSSSMVLIRLLKCGSAWADPRQTLVLLEEHARGTGKHGGNVLAYDNGAVAEDGGILLWVQEKHNELDAGVNLNILCLLAALLERVDAADRDRVTGLAAPALAFLERHIGFGSYARKPFLMFYSLEAFSFLWYRFALCLDALPAGLRAGFDPGDVAGSLGRHLKDLVEKELAGGKPGFNSFDRLLVLPLLLRHASPAARSMLSGAALRAMVDDVSSQAYEFGKFVYPFTFLYGNRSLGLCAALMALREIGKTRMPSLRADRPG